MVVVENIKTSGCVSIPLHEFIICVADDIDHICFVPRRSPSTVDVYNYCQLAISFELYVSDMWLDDILCMTTQDRHRMFARICDLATEWFGINWIIFSGMLGWCVCVCVCVCVSVSTASRQIAARTDETVVSHDMIL